MPSARGMVMWAVLVLQEAGLSHGNSSVVPHFLGRREVDIEPGYTLASNISAAWTPGIGGCCAGVWTKKYHDISGDIPKGLVDRLDQSGPSGKLLLDRLLAGECPYGHNLPGDVSWRGSIPKELHDLVAPQDFISVLAVIWSFLPYAVAVFVLVDFFRAKLGIRQFLILLWLAILVVINEGIVKRLFNQPRPGTLLQTTDYTGKFVGSCVPSCGMPSSHSALACGWFVLLFLDAAVRVHPNAFEIDTQADLEEPDSVVIRSRGRREARRNVRTFLGFVVLTPWANNARLTHTEFIAYTMVWATIMLPVPFFRVVLYDHTADQVLVGSIIGIALAALWFRVMRRLQDRFDAQGPPGSKVWGVFVHNYPRPTFPLVEMRQIATHDEDVVAISMEQWRRQAASPASPLPARSFGSCASPDANSFLGAPPPAPAAGSLAGISSFGSAASFSSETQVAAAAAEPPSVESSSAAEVAAAAAEPPLVESNSTAGRGSSGGASSC